MEAGEFNVLRGKPRLAHAKYRLGPGGISIELYYRDKNTGTQIVRVHQLERADGTLGGGGEPDPKELYKDGILYHQHPGSRWWHRIRRDPSILCPDKPMGPIYRAYVAWRRLKCDRWSR